MKATAISQRMVPRRVNVLTKALAPTEALSPGSTEARDTATATRNRELRAERTRRKGNPLVNGILDRLARLRRLSTGHYEWTPEQIDTLERTLKSELARTLEDLRGGAQTLKDIL